MQIKAVVRKLSRLVKWTLPMVFIYAVGMVAINAHDEAPDPRITAFITSTAPAVPDAENAFFTMLAFDAPTDMDAHAAGLKMAAHHEEIYKEDPYTPNYPGIVWESRAYPPVTEMIGDKHLNNLVCVNEGDCGNWRTVSTYDLRAQIEKYSALLARYETLYTYPAFRETETPVPGSTTTDLLGFTLREIHQVELARVALDLRGGKTADALARLARDAAFWRMVVRDTEVEGNRNDAVAYVTEDVALLSDVLSTETLDATSLNSANAMLAPLGPQAMSCHAIFRHKFLVSRQGIRMYLHGEKFRILRPFVRFDVFHLHGDPKDAWAVSLDDAYYKAFFKENATVNRIYRDYAAAEQITELPPGAFVQYVGQHLDRRPLMDGINASWKDHFYNPLGSGRSYVGYYDTTCRARPIDLEGYIRLVTLQLKAKQQGVTEQTMAAFLRDAGPGLTDPYTSAPMTYDAKARQLYFTGLGYKAFKWDRRISVPL